MSCPDCISGTLHTTATVGSDTKLHGLDVYITGPALDKSKAIIVMIPDAFGWAFPNNRIWADEVAARTGWSVLLPDFMNGTAADPTYIDAMPQLLKTDSLSAWLAKPYHLARVLAGFASFQVHNTFSAAWPRVTSFFAALRSVHGSLPVAAAGFCWGGPLALRLCHADAIDAKGRALVDAAFLAHPAPLRWPEDVTGAEQPFSVAIGTRDWCTSLARVRELQGLVERMDELSRAQVRLFEGAGHGFAVRYDPENENMKTQAEEAQVQAVRWFESHFLEKS